MLWVYPSGLVENDSHELPKKKTRWFMTFRTHARLFSSPSSRLESILLLPFLRLTFLMSGWVCQWKPFWIPLGESFQKAYLEEWIRMGDDSSDEQGYKGYISKSKLREEAAPAPRPAGQPDALPLESIGPQSTASFWERTGAPLPPLRSRCNFIHPKQLSPFPERLKLPFSSEEILSGFKDIVSSGTDQFTAWVKTGPHATLVRHMVDVRKATADFQEASERRHGTPSQANRFNKSISNRSPVQKQLSIHNWNPGPRRGKEGAFEKQIAGKWHVITLQEAIEYVDHDILAGRFHVTHYGGCAILFNEDTFHPNIDVKSIYLHDTRRDLPDQVMEGEQGWFLQGTLSRASFRRPPLSGQETCTVLSLHNIRVRINSNEFGCFWN